MNNERKNRINFKGTFRFGGQTNKHYTASFIFSNNLKKSTGVVYLKDKQTILCNWQLSKQDKKKQTKKTKQKK